MFWFFWTIASAFRPIFVVDSFLDCLICYYYLFFDWFFIISSEYLLNSSSIILLYYSWILHWSSVIICSEVSSKNGKKAWYEVNMVGDSSHESYQIPSTEGKIKCQPPVFLSPVRVVLLVRWFQNRGQSNCLNEFLK